MVFHVANLDPVGALGLLRKWMGEYICQNGEQMICYHSNRDLGQYRMSVALNQNRGEDKVFFVGL